MRVMGIDPAPAKDWLVLEAKVGERDVTWSGNEREAFYRRIPVRQLREFALEVRDGEGVVVMDCPICFPDMSHWLMGEGAAATARHFPFDVNPFSQRPVEKLFSSKPPKQPVAKSLKKAIETLSVEGQSVAAWHDGLSVLGYSGVPHWAVVQAFLEIVAGHESNPSADPANGLMVLESHPAVNLASWYSQANRRTLPKYKKELPTDLVDTALKKVQDAVGDIPVSPTDSDELDALVSFLAGVEVARGTADWLGDKEDGYFMMPGEADRPTKWNELYSEAKREVRCSLKPDSVPA